MNRISMHSVVVASPQQVSSPVGEETVILQLDDGIYYGLDPIGTRVWQQLQRPGRVAGIRDRILAEYAVEPKRCERELAVLLGELVDRRLVRILEPAEARAIPPPGWETG